MGLKPRKKKVVKTVKLDIPGILAKHWKWVRNEKGWRVGGPRRGEPRRGEPRRGGPRRGGPHHSDPRLGNPHQSEPHQSEPHRGGPRRGRPHRGEPERHMPRSRGPVTKNGSVGTRGKGWLVLWIPDAEVPTLRRYCVRAREIL